MRARSLKTIEPAIGASISRRRFLKSGAAGAAVLGFDLSLTRLADANSRQTIDVHSWIAIQTDNRVVVRIPQSELGQGATTALMQILAEEVDLDLALTDWEFYDPQTNVQRQNVYVHTATLSSWGIKMLFQPLREAGAQIRQLLLNAAAAALGTPADNLEVSNHKVTDRVSGRAITYARLAATAATLPLPDSAKPKSPDQWRYIGRAVPRNDAEEKSTGRAQYGIDLILPGMKYAAVRQCPVFGGRLRSFDEAKIGSMPGVRGVVAIKAGPSGYTVPPTLWDVIDWEMDDAVAVVADSWWQAEQALKALPIEWDEGDHANVDSAEIDRRLSEALAGAGEVVFDEGDAAGAMNTATRLLESTYDYPFMEHAPMEPMNCTAVVEDRRVEAWGPTQYGDEALRIAAYAAGVALKDARFHLTLAGGGFGRRLHNDYVSQAVQVARQMPGTPVKLLWSRAENTRRSYYPPPIKARLRAGLNQAGELVAWKSHVAQGRGVFQPYGLTRLAYAVGAYEVRFSEIDTPPGFAWMRGVGHTQMAWMNHAFLCEIAAARGLTSLEQQRELLDISRLRRDRPDYDDAAYRIGRFKQLLDAVVSQSSDISSDQKGHGRGYAVYDMSYVPGFESSCIAIALDVVLDGDGGIRVSQVCATVDCGRVINPDLVKNQITGGILFGLSNALYAKITLSHGRVEQSNFHDYPILRLADSPAVDVDIVPSDAPPSGVGEGATPVVIAALVDAIHAAGGPHIRALPITGQNLRFRNDP